MWVTLPCDTCMHQSAALIWLGAASLLLLQRPQREILLYNRPIQLSQAPVLIMLIVPHPGSNPCPELNCRAHFSDNWGTPQPHAHRRPVDSSSEQATGYPISLINEQSALRALVTQAATMTHCPVIL